MILYTLQDSVARNINVAILSFGFMTLFASFHGLASIQTLIIDNAKKENSSGYVEDFNGNGYYASAIIYTGSALFNRLAPPIIAFIGLKWAIVVSSMAYGLFVASFIKLMDWSLYTTAVLLGFGGAFLWPAKGAFLTINSTPETMTRNSGIFSSMFWSSYLVGGIIAYTQFAGVDDISSETRTLFIIIFFSLSCFATLTLALLLPTPWQEEEQKQESPWKTLKKSFQLFAIKNMQYLVICFFFNGIQLSFCTGVYPTAMGFTMNFSGSKGFATLHGIVVGASGLVSGSIIALIGHKTNTVGRYPIIIFGYVAYVIGYVIAVLNIPNAASMEETYDDAIIESNKALALFSSVMFGIGDTCFNSQIMALLGIAFRDSALPAYSLFKLISNSTAAAVFFSASFIPLYYTITVLAVSGGVGTICFTIVDISVLKGNRNSESFSDKAKKTDKHIE